MRSSDWSSDVCSSDLFKPAEKLAIRPESGRHINPSNMLPDTMNCDLPLENHRGAGHRNFSWKLAGNTFIGFVAEYPPGRYRSEESRVGKEIVSTGRSRWST